VLRIGECVFKWRQRPPLFAFFIYIGEGFTIDLVALMPGITVHSEHANPGNEQPTMPCGTCTACGVRHALRSHGLFAGKTKKTKRLPFLSTELHGSPFVGLIDELARGVESLVVVIADIKSFSTFRQTQFRPCNRVSFDTEE
jgi:hypothetical protein